jgi:glycosyltransferase involved in cell wall biosynthesis
LSNDITVLPPTNDEVTIAGYYDAADLYVLPSLEDNLPNTISEALSCGCPVVAFPTGGIPEMIEQHLNGAACAESTALSIVETIAALGRDTLLPRAEIAANAHRTYAPERIASLHLASFAEAKCCHFKVPNPTQKNGQAK